MMFNISERKIGFYYRKMLADMMKSLPGYSKDGSCERNGSLISDKCIVILSRNAWICKDSLIPLP
jgi:hypothetical protein